MDFENKIIVSKKLSIATSQKIMRSSLNPFALRHLMRFGLVGLAGTLVYYAVLWTLVELARLPVMLATCCAFVLVVSENYLFHRFSTFQSVKPHREAVPRFMIVSGLGFCVNATIMSVGLHRFGISYLSVQAIALVVVVACNFIGSFWIFKCDNRVHDVISLKEAKQ